MEDMETVQTGKMVFLLEEEAGVRGRGHCQGPERAVNLEFGGSFNESTHY